MYLLGGSGSRLLSEKEGSRGEIKNRIFLIHSEIDLDDADVFTLLVGFAISDPHFLPVIRCTRGILGRRRGICKIVKSKMERFGRSERDVSDRTDLLHRADTRIKMSDHGSDVTRVFSRRFRDFTRLQIFGNRSQSCLVPRH